jgi:hypothetical protein
VWFDAITVPTPGTTAADPPRVDDGTSFFDAVHRWDWPMPGAWRVPLFFPSLSCVAAVYTASTERALELLPDRRMRPVEVMPGRCLFAIAGLDYRQGDLGPYRELALAVPIAFGSHPLPLLDAVRHGFARAFSGYVWQMPVTTAAARDAGLGLAGFPKTLADIRFDVDDRQVQCSLHEMGAVSVTLLAPAAVDDGERQLKLRAYTVQSGVPLVSTLLLRQTCYRDHLQRDAAQLELGRGPLAQALRKLDLSDRPLASHWCAGAQAMLFFPRNVMDD